MRSSVRKKAFLACEFDTPNMQSQQSTTFSPPSRQPSPPPPSSPTPPRRFRGDGPFSFQPEPLHKPRFSFPVSPPSPPPPDEQREQRGQRFTFPARFRSFSSLQDTSEQESPKRRVVLYGICVLILTTVVVLVNAVISFLEKLIMNEAWWSYLNDVIKCEREPCSRIARFVKINDTLS